MTRRRVGQAILAVWGVGVVVAVCGAAVEDGYPWWAGLGLLVLCVLAALSLAVGVIYVVGPDRDRS